MRLKWISKPYQNEFSYLINLRNQKIKYKYCQVGFSLWGCSYYRNITSKHSQFYYWHSKEQIRPGCLCFTMKWWHKTHFVKIFLPLNDVGIQYIFGGNITHMLASIIAQCTIVLDINDMRTALSPLNTSQKTNWRSMLFVTMLHVITLYM